MEEAVVQFVKKENEYNYRFITCEGSPCSGACAYIPDQIISNLRDCLEVGKLYTAISIDNSDWHIVNKRN